LVKKEVYLEKIIIEQRDQISALQGGGPKDSQVSKEPKYED
jgi:hypothetical protein